MKTDKFMYLLTMTEDEFVENIGKEDFFRRFGNPAVIRTQAGERVHRAERRIIRSNGRTMWLSGNKGVD